MGILFNVRADAQSSSLTQQLYLPEDLLLVIWDSVREGPSSLLNILILFF